VSDGVFILHYITNHLHKLFDILIRRLRMTASKAIKAYMKLMLVTPIKAAKDKQERRDNVELFKAAFIDVLKDAGSKPNVPMLDHKGIKT
jgi:hypothetical protein